MRNKVNITESFKRVDSAKMYDTYGGWAWALAMPFLLQGIAAIVSSVRMFFADDGSVKTDGKTYEGKWSTNESSSASHANPKEQASARTLVYAY